MSDEPPSGRNEMAGVPPADTGSPELISALFTWHVKPGREQDFEAWAHRMTATAGRFPGHLGASWLRSDHDSHEFQTVLRWSGAQQYWAWIESSERAACLRQGQQFMQHPQPVGVHATGLETWFTLPGQRTITPPPRWKMWLLTLIAVFPLALLFQMFVIPHLRGLPLVARSAALGGTLTTLMTFVVMPTLTRALRRWLYPSTEQASDAPAP